MSTPAAIPWVQFDERVVGENHPTFDDVDNRVGKFIVTQSDLAETDDFPGFLVKYTGVATPEGAQTAGPGAAFIDLTGQIFYIKMSGIGNTGWAAIGGNLSGNGSPETVVTAPIGKLYEQRDAAAGGHSVWFKATGVGNTGWRKFASFVEATDNAIIVTGTTGTFSATTTDAIGIGNGITIGAINVGVFGKSAIANGADAYAFGSAATTGTSVSGIAFGKAATLGALADNSIAFGTAATISAAVTSAIAIGNGALAVAADNISIGRIATPKIAEDIVIGKLATIATTGTATFTSASIVIGADAGLKATTSGSNLGSIVIGRGAKLESSAGGSRGIVIGSGALANPTSGQEILLIGNSSGSQTGTTYVHIGHNLPVNAAQNTVIIGNNPVGIASTTSNSVAIGDQLTIADTRNISIGSQSTCNGRDSVVIGHLATVTRLGSFTESISIGASATQANLVQGGIVVGANSSLGNTHYASIIIGTRIASSVSREITLGNGGGNTLAAGNMANTSIRMGGGPTEATYPGFVYNHVNGSGSDNAVTGVTFIAPRSTGSATQGNIIFQTGQPGASSSTIQTATTRLTLSTFAAYTLAPLPAANANAVCVDITGTITEAGSGTHARLMGLSVTAPTITGGAAAVTDAATVYISDAPAASGAQNWAIWVDAGAARFDGTMFIGDVSNASSTLGLTINQAANDDEILSLKSSDVAHGMTTLTETDTFGYITKVGPTTGGLNFFGYISDRTAIAFNARYTTDDTSKTNSSDGAVNIRASKKSGTTVGAPGANANILVVQSDTNTRFILDADGDSHQDVGTAWTNFDTHDDIELLNKLSAHVTRKDDPLRYGFREWMEKTRADLVELKLVSFNDDGHHFVNMSRLTMLHTGAIRQLGERFNRIEKALVAAKLLPAEV